MTVEKLLEENIKEFLKGANNAKTDGSYNSAVTLFFKALAVMADLFILKKEGFIPSNHSERFKILKEKYLHIYRVLDKDFPIYQDSYRLKINKETVEVIEKDAKELARITGIEM